MIERRSQLLAYFSLFGSISTLICCALPALLVSLGLGAVLAGLASNIPALIWVSENKLVIFLLAGTTLAFNGWLLWRNQTAPCPVHPSLREVCIAGRRMSRTIYLVSLSIFIVGFSFAYLA